MSLSLHIEADNAADLMAQVVALASSFGAAPAAPAAKAAATTTKTKAEPAKETKVEPKEEPAAEPVEEQGDVPSADDVTDAAQAFIKANSREALIELLGTFDAKNISGLPEDKRAAFIAKCKA